MRWGVRDEATDDHMTTELCMKEIQNCQRLSMGPNFVVSQHLKPSSPPTSADLNFDNCRFFSGKNTATGRYRLTSCRRSCS